MKRSLSSIIILIFLCLFSSCKSKSPKYVELELNQLQHQFYYFSDNNFYKIDKPDLAPNVLAKPWTEAVRITSAGTAKNTGFALVNQTGILTFSEAKPELHCDSTIFNQNTTENLVFYEGTPVFSVYKSSFFNNTIDKAVFHPFLVQFNPEQNLFFPIINIENLFLERNSQVTDFIWDGQFWTCCIKNSSHEKIDFSYITFQIKTPLLSITPQNANNELFVTETSMDSYRKAKNINDITKAPDRIKELLKTVPDSVPYMCKVYTTSSHSPRTYISSKSNAESADFKATAILSDTWACAIFEDGTTFFNGALYDRQILNGGKTLAMKMPKLPQGFIYTDFAISGTNLYIGWEERDFYQTKRSGFLSVDLSSVLYKNGTVK